jgi:hypothetical protein
MLIQTYAAAMSLMMTLGAVEVPWGAGQSLGEKKVLSETTVCTDNKGHYAVVAPHEHRGRQLFYGDTKALYSVPLPLANISGEHFFEPRYPNPTHNPDFRGADMRVHGSVEVQKDKCQVECGQRNIDLTIVPEDQARDFLLKAKVQESPQQFMPHALLRDTKGRYYLVERSTRPNEEKNFKLWVGPKGKLKEEKMQNMVADSEGEVFSTRGGELRLLLDRVQPSFWIEGKQKTELRAVPVGDNLTLIYGDLGVHRGARLGNPCDDL